MTKNEIILMADASGLSYYGMGKDRDKFLHYLEAFANLVNEEWLMSGAVVPVDVETTAALVAEIKRLIDVVGDMALAQPERRKPLTDEEIRRIKPVSPDLVDFRSGVRCAEAAHGIKE